MRASLLGAVLALLVLPAPEGAFAQPKNAREISPELRSVLGSISSYAGQAASFQARLGWHNDLSSPDLAKLEDAERWITLTSYCLDALNRAYAAGAMAEHEVSFDTKGLPGDDGPLKAPLSIAQAERFCTISRALAEAHVRDIKAIAESGAPVAQGEIPGLGAEALAQLAGRFASAAAQGLSRLGVNDRDRPDLSRRDDTGHWRISSTLCLLYADRAKAQGFDATRTITFRTFGARLNEAAVADTLSLGSLHDFCQASKEAAEAHWHKLGFR